MIHLTIDGIPVEVEKGTTILQAARQIGVEIPTLCYLEDVLPDGSCRLCVVEVTNNGRTKFDTACTLRCSEGDEVQTMSEKVVAYRKDTLDLLLSDHRVHCFSCEANGDCKLQDYCFEYGVTETSYPGDIYKTGFHRYIQHTIPLFQEDCRCHRHYESWFPVSDRCTLQT